MNKARVPPFVWHKLSSTKWLLFYNHIQDLEQTKYLTVTMAKERCGPWPGLGWDQTATKLNLAANIGGLKIWQVCAVHTFVLCYAERADYLLLWMNGIRKYCFHCIPETFLFLHDNSLSCLSCKVLYTENSKWQSQLAPDIHGVYTVTWCKCTALAITKQCHSALYSQVCPHNVPHSPSQ